MMIALRIPRLTFVSLGSGKTHIRDTVNGAATMCGRDIPEGTPVLPERKLARARLCGRCYASLRTFGSGQVRIEEEL